jgi:diguanylate cyclase (GGDEF)-like protein
MKEHLNLAADVTADPEFEVAVLRAALADAQARIRELEERSETDPLTGLADGRRFARALERVAAVAQRQGTTAAVVCIELAGLEQIEDAHGAMGVEAAVLHLGKTLAGLIRTTDLLARTGAHEFGLILDHMDHDSAIDTAERLGRCVAGVPLDLGNGGVQLKTVAAATALLPGDSAPEVLTRAARNLALARSEA